MLPGLVAAAALLIDYVLTVSVSVVAGVFAITRRSRRCSPYKVGDLVGVRRCSSRWRTSAACGSPARSSRSPPTPSSCRIVIMVVVGLVRCVGGCAAVVRARVDPGAWRRRGGRRAFVAAPAGVLLRLRPRSPAWRRSPTACRRSGRPQAKNAAETLAIMGVDLRHDVPRHHVPRQPHRTCTVVATSDRSSPRSRRRVVRRRPRVLRRAGLHRRDPGPGGEHVVPGLPAAVVDPRRDRFMPRQFVNRGDRLVFSNGVVVLGAASRALLIVRLRRGPEPADPALRRRGVHVVHAVADRHGAALAEARTRKGDGGGEGLAPIDRHQRDRRHRDRGRAGRRDPHEVPARRLDLDRRHDRRRAGCSAAIHRHYESVAGSSAGAWCRRAPWARTTSCCWCATSIPPRPRPSATSGRSARRTCTSLYPPAGPTVPPDLRTAGRTFAGDAVPPEALGGRRPAARDARVRRRHRAQAGRLRDRGGARSGARGSGRLRPAQARADPPQGRPARARPNVVVTDVPVAGPRTRPSRRRGRAADPARVP